MGLIPSKHQQAVREKYFYDELILKIKDFTIHLRIQRKVVRRGPTSFRYLLQYCIKNL